MAVGPDRIAQLRDHFAAGPTIAAGANFPDQRAPVVSASLHVIELTVPSFGDAQIVATDGSADVDEGDAQVAGCAAVSADGRALLAWFDLHADAGGVAATYAEWQGARLGLRLAADWAAVRLLTDNKSVVKQLQRILDKRKADPRAIGGNDELAMDEICRRARAVPLTVNWVPCGAGRRTGAVTLTRFAHAGAWLMHRLAANGADPTEHVDWIAEVIARAPGHQKELRQAYLKRFNPARAAASRRKHAAR